MADKPSAVRICEQQIAHLATALEALSQRLEALETLAPTPIVLASKRQFALAAASCDVPGQRVDALVIPHALETLLADLRQTPRLYHDLILAARQIQKGTREGPLTAFLDAVVGVNDAG